MAFQKSSWKELPDIQTVFWMSDLGPESATYCCLGIAAWVSRALGRRFIPASPPRHHHATQNNWGVGRMSERKKRQSGVARAIFGSLMLGLLSVLPMTAATQPEKGQVRISLIIPERPHRRFTRYGTDPPGLRKAKHTPDLSEIHHLESKQRLERCLPGAERSQSLTS